MVTRIKQQSSSSHPLLITHCVTVERDQTWKISVHGHELNPQENEKLSLMPSRIQSACSLNHLLSTIDHLHVCAGHPDENFLRMVEDKKGKLISVKGTVAAYIDTNAYVELNGQTYATTLRHSKCQLLTSAKKCIVCVNYRATVRSIYHRWIKSLNKSPSCIPSTSSHVNNKWLKTPERKEKAKNLKKRVISAENSMRYTYKHMRMHACIPDTIIDT